MAGRRCRSFTQPHHRRTRRAPYGRPATPPIIQRVVGGRMNRRICMALIAPVLMIVHPALALYHAQKPNSLEGLKRFVATHFELPNEAATPPAPSEQVPIRRHIDSLWT